jgi:MFS family permease
MTWGGLPLFVPVGYISYFVLPAVTGAALGRWLSAKFGWRRPTTLLIVGLVVGFCWALFFNGFLGAKLGVFYYGRVIPGLAIREGTVHQYPLYDSLAMGIQMMVFTYLLGRTDAQGRNVIEMWADKRSKSRRQASILSVVAIVVIGNLLYSAVFAPHLVTKLGGWVTAEPTGQLFPGVPNQPK